MQTLNCSRYFCLVFAHLFKKTEIILCSGLLFQPFWNHFSLLILQSPSSTSAVFTVVFPHCYVLFLWILRNFLKYALYLKESTFHTANSAFLIITPILILPLLSWFHYDISSSHPWPLFLLPSQPTPFSFQPIVLLSDLLMCSFFLDFHQRHKWMLCKIRFCFLLTTFLIGMLSLCILSFTFLSLCVRIFLSGPSV